MIEKQELRRRGLPQYDIRNALRLCPPNVGEGCHGGQTTALRRVPASALTDDNVAYAFEKLGPFAFYYITRRYAGGDERLDRAVAEAE